jgi:hypothetical protein
MKNLKTTLQLIAVFFISNTPVFAQNPAWLNSIASGIIGVVPALVTALVGVALLYFIWGLVLFISQSGDEKAVEEGKQKMIWGLIALFVLVSVWGLVSLLQTVSGIDGGTNPGAPQTTYTTSGG